MVHAPAASGMLFRALGQETTFFHGKGKEALVEIEGRRLPTCRQAEPPALPFRARGQEPGWNVALADGVAELVLDYGEQRVSLPLFATSSEGRVTRFRAADGTHRMAMDVARRQCNDSMSGMPFPYVVALEFDDRVLTGCGGEPVDLLRGHEWVVEDLDGGGIIDSSRISIEFDAESGRVHGLASCNRYSAGYALGGEGLSFSGATATRRACAPALMHQEQKFFQILAGTYRFDIDATGALLLSGSAGSMKAYATTPAPR
jgi:heat shock protein HslJ